MEAQSRRIFLFALPRSGSTLLCDALSIPHRGVILHEPMPLRRFGDGREQRISENLQQLGIEVELPDSVQDRSKAAREWYEASVFPHLQQLSYWGIKEVYLNDAEQLIARYQPDDILLLWRDPRDVSLSFLELMNRSLMAFPDRRTLKDEAWAWECLRDSARVLHRIATKHAHLPLQYEALMSDPAARQRLLHRVGIDRFNTSPIAMAGMGDTIRGAEAARHRNLWSSRSVARWQREPAGWRRVFATVCHAVIAPYLNGLSYDAPTLSASEVCSNDQTDSLQRLVDPGYIPANGFDFAYARRRARQKVAAALPRGSRVLDVGASTAALHFLGEDFEATAVDDGAPGKKVISKPWREGVFPKLTAYDTVTFLFSLEYVDDPCKMIQPLLERGLRVIVSYHCIDDLSHNKRSRLEFTSHLSRADWVQFAGAREAKARFAWAYDGFQSLIWFEPQSEANERD